MFNRQTTYRFKLLLCCTCIVLVLLVVSASAQTGKDTLPAVIVSAIKYADVTSSPVPVQQLTKKEIGSLNSFSVADAVKYFSGVQVKDYGGVGGLKTISLRSLGANHTGVMYDGVMLTDAQGGQIDLGKLSLDNIDQVTLYNGQPNDLLVPARSFAYAGVLSLRSPIPQYDSLKPLHVKASVKAGSFGLVNPSVLLRYNFNRHFYNSFNAEWMRSDGQYPYNAYEAGGGRVKRQNSDVDALRLEYDAAFAFNDNDNIRLKAYYYNSDRGLPGSVILYNTYSGQRLKDENFFIQSSWQKYFSSRSKLLLNVKYACNYSFYLDPDYPNTQGKLENKFHQKEYYLSAAYSYDVSKVLSLAYSGDASFNELTRSDEFVLDFPDPKRTILLNDVAVKLLLDKLTIGANLLHSWYKDKVKYGTDGKDIDAFSPGIAVNYQPSANSPLRLRFFYKNIFRAPTFNDLYYTFIGNTSLRPEYAKQYNAGITYKVNGRGFLQSSVFTLDAYYNTVKDKILAVPRQNLFQWTMLNLGKVQIKGLDAALQFYPASFNNINISARLSYTYQQALDVSDKNSALYKKQLPYTPEHSGSMHISIARKKLMMAYNVLLSGYRYRLGDQLPENLVKEWATQDVMMGYNFTGGKNLKCRLFAEVNNIFNKQYEIIKLYPMPGINYRAGLVAEF
ncbi:TonB-dependent receptor [Ferruginibacter sp. HRS2-29]|uniref:TonB-dependent receptor n=1 Tax=Ferruginibacter sp. HRS2-29 TaxID=2487334 RepID=UPI0020CF4AD6|nr:TonB-dependent receptor [Ferruginibacter sp. HRS2-29]MCP9750381.1 TonB-dependent receptor [Ferruginibacter sp. HRS2-29]